MIHAQKTAKEEENVNIFTEFKKKKKNIREKLAYLHNYV